jgi:hypothetical protein
MKKTLLFSIAFMLIYINPSYARNWVEVDASGTNAFTGTMVYSGTGKLSPPGSTSLPGTCAVREVYIDTDATTGQRIYLCESTDSWVLQGDGGGALGATVDDTELTSEDFGDFSCDGTEDGCSLDAGTVATSEILDDTITSADLDTTNGTTDEFCLTWEDASNELEWQACSAAAHGDGANCAAGEYPLGVDSSGAVQSCTDATTEINAVAATQDECSEITSCVVDAWDADGDIAADEISESKINFSTACAAGNHYYLSGNDLACEANTTDTNLTSEEVQDFCGAMATGNTETGIAVTYQDGDGTIDYVVDHDTANNFITTEHIDWTAGSAGTIHTDNYVENPFGATIDDTELTSETYGDYTCDSTEDGCTVTAIQGVTIVDTAITTNWILKYDGSNLVYSADSGSGGGGSTTFPLYPYSGKLTGAYVTATISGADVAVGAAIDAGDGNWRVLFDASTDEAIVFYGILPTNYSSTPVINIIYTMVSGTANEVEWEAAIQCTTPGDAEDLGTETFAAVGVSAVTVPGTAGYTDTLVSVTPTDDSCAANDLIYVYISTDANDATSDDATGDRELVGVYGSFTGS